MGFLDTLERVTNDLVKSLSPEQVVMLKSCETCNFYKKGYCTQTSPPTRILSEYQAQACLYYTIEQLTQVSTVETVEKSEAVYVKGTKGVEGRKFSKHGDLAANTDDTVCNLSKKDVVIESLQFGTNSIGQCGVSITPYKADGIADSSWELLDYEGYAVHGFRPCYLHFHPSAMWKEDVYDETENHFKYSLTRPLRFPNGVLIQRYNRDLSDLHRCGVVCLVSIQGE